MKEIEEKCNLILCGRKVQSGKTYYCAKRKGEKKYTYIGGESSKDVNDIKEAKYLKKSLQRIKRDIHMLEKTINHLKDIDYDAVNESLPLAYRDACLDVADSRDKRALMWKSEKEEIKGRFNVYKPEDLKNRNDDGNYVRSKSEAMIYNHLLSLGISFMYEMPTEICGAMYWPDFVILSEEDFKTEIIIEHQGMMANDQYRNRFYDKLYGYLCAGYVPGINIFFTFDAIDGGFDKTPIDDIVRTRIRPCN